jgi:hypothetical protein
VFAAVGVMASFLSIRGARVRRRFTWIDRKDGQI